MRWFDVVDRESFEDRVDRLVEYVDLIILSHRQPRGLLCFALLPDLLGVSLEIPHRHLWFVHVRDLLVYLLSSHLHRKIVHLCTLAKSQLHNVFAIAKCSSRQCSVAIPLLSVHLCAPA